MTVFLSTPSARRATQERLLHSTRKYISIHALREEGDIEMQSPYRMDGNFYPRPPRGGRPHVGRGHSRVNQFLSTPSARRATIRAGEDFFNHGFLSTPSARRATAAFQQPIGIENISIHALREEGDHVSFRHSRVVKISIHALREEGDPPPPGTMTTAGNFYPRPPRGGRPPVCISLITQ